MDRAVVGNGRERALSLDALRGLAIGLMCLSGIVPRGLPNWMYHGYHPQFVPDDSGVWRAVENPWAFRAGWASFTWVDWVFPMFLFAMGAAIPLALRGRLSRVMSRPKLLPHVVWRFVVLMLFAVYVQQLSPYQIENPPSAGAWVLGLIAFVVLFAVFMRLPTDVPVAVRRGIQWAGVLVALLLLVYMNVSDGERAFSWGRNDIIIVLLAWSSLVASLLWLVTINRPAVRLIFGLAIAWLAHWAAMKSEWRFPADDGVVGSLLSPLVAWLQAPKALLDWTLLNDVLPGSLPGGVLNLAPLYDFTWLKFLWIVVPGTVIGDLLVTRSSSSANAMPNPPATAIPAWKHALLVLCALLTVLIAHAGLKDYATTWATIGPVELSNPGAAALFAPAVMLVMLLLVARKGDDDATYLQSLVLHGVVWTTLGLGLCMIPDFRGITDTGFFENGISKGPPSTLSYYALSLGLSVLLLGALVVVIDLHGFRRPFAPLIGAGQNPMLAYVGIRNLLAPLVALPLLALFTDDAARASLNGLVSSLIRDTDGEPWWEAGWALLKTLGLLVAAWGLTVRRAVWRA